jgi:two-component system sensor histidine kinase/response regulator
LIDELESKLPAEKISATANIDWIQLEQICNRLAELLTENDAEAADLLQDHTDLLQNAFRKNYKAIASAINAFDFNIAHSALILALETLKKDAKIGV